MGFRLNNRCKHCGEELILLMKKEFPSGELKALVKHEWDSTFENTWKTVTGFDDSPKLEEQFSR